MQKLATRRGSQAFALVAAIALIAVAIAFACPGRAFAAKSVAHLVDEGGDTVETYATIADAIKGATLDMDSQYSRTLVMDGDWNTTEVLTVTDSKALTIDMNGHKVTGNGKDAVFRLYENSKLTLKSTSKASFSFKGYSGDNGEEADCNLTTGGLVTGGSSLYAGGIRMDAESTLTLDGVAVAGNRGTSAGGVYALANCSINMYNGASVCNNTGQAGGMYVAGPDTNDETRIVMSESSICDNYASKYGGGIYSYVDATRIFMSNGSSISNNTAKYAGGGIFFSYTYFHLESVDNSASVANNKTTTEGDDNKTKCGGGGIYIDSASLKKHLGTIKGITISGNSTVGNGGGIGVCQPNTTISNCTIESNTANGHGGGIDVQQENTTISNCTIKNNTANGQGGGVRLMDSDSTIDGCEIIGNVCDAVDKNYEGGGVYIDSAYDVTLSGKCTISGNTRGKGGSADDLFLDTGLTTQGHILGGVDEGSSVGVRTGDTGSSCMVGWKISRYTAGTYFMDLDNYRITHGTDLDGDLWQRKVSPFSNFTVTVKKPVTDEKLAATATLSWGESGSKEVGITWYDENGNKVTKAQHGQSYYFTLNTPEDLDCGLTFDGSIQTSNVKLIMKDGSESAGIKDAHLDSGYYLDITSNLIQTVDPKSVGGDDGMEKANDKTSGASVSTSGADTSNVATEQAFAAGSGSVLVQTGDPLPMGVFAIVAAGALASVAAGAFALRRRR